MWENCTAVYETARGPGEALQAWSGFRTVGNLKFPFHNVTCRDVVKFSEHGVEGVRLDPRLDSVISDKPFKQPKEGCDEDYSTRVLARHRNAPRLNLWQIERVFASIPIGGLYPA